MVDFASNSIVNIAPNNASDLEIVSTDAAAWTQKLIGNTEFARQLGYNHSKIMNARYGLNARFRRGFMISPTTPWRNAEMVEAGVTTPLDLAQITITTVLLSLDSNVGQTYVSTVPTPVAGSTTARRLLGIPTEVGMKHSISRMLLQLDSPNTPPATNAMPTATREITSVDDNQNVMRAVCNDRPSNHKCDMVQLRKQVSLADFCQSEDEISANILPSMRQILSAASDNAVLDVTITSISQPGKSNICGSQIRRRLLETKHELVMTLVYELQALRDRFRFNNSMLQVGAVSGLKALTNQTYWQMCGVSGTPLEDCVEKIVTSTGLTREIVLQFSVDNSMNMKSLDQERFRNILMNAYRSNNISNALGGLQVQVVLSIPILVMGNSTEFHATITVPFLAEYTTSVAKETNNNLMDAGFELEDTLQHQVVLNWMSLALLRNVTDQRNIQTILAKVYQVDPSKTRIIEIISVPNTQQFLTKLTIQIKTPLAKSYEPDADAMAVQKYTAFERMLVAAKYKVSPASPLSMPQPVTTSADNTPGLIALVIFISLIGLGLGAAFFYYAYKDRWNAYSHQSVPSAPFEYTNQAGILDNPQFPTGVMYNGPTHMGNMQYQTKRPPLYHM
jgi:hypothetical protein